MPYDIEDVGRSVDRLEDTISDAVHNMTENKENNMNYDIAGLMALMQNHRNMDIPGLLALCKDKGYDRGWGGEGMFMFVFLMLFLLGNGGWNGLNRNQQADFAAAAGLSNQGLTEVLATYDKLSQMQQANSNGFQQLQTWLCQSIDAVNAATRDQGDRTYDATRNVGDAVRECCCNLNARLATIECELKGLSRDISDTNRNLGNKIDLSQERINNAMERMECRLSTQIKETQCLITNTAQQQEMDRLRRENDALRNKVNGDAIADAAVAKLQTFAMNHYVPTRTGTTTPTTGA